MAIPQPLIKFARGFTMIELLISIGIFVIITGLVIVNFRSGQYRDELAGAAGIVQAALREIQTAASSGTVTPSPCVASTPAAPPPSGYGLHLDLFNNTVVTFADCETVPTYTYYPNDTSVPLRSILIRNVLYSTNVILSQLKVDGVAVGSLDLVFDPFVETVMVNGVSATNIDITLQHPKGANAVLHVCLNAAAGQVFINSLPCQ